MRRPVAVFGCALLVFMFASVNMPAVVLYALAGIFGVALLCTVLFCRRVLRGGLIILFAAGTLAFGFKASYDALAVTPIQNLAGQTVLVQARVLNTQPGFGDDTVDALLEIITIDGKDDAGGFNVLAYGLPELQSGELISAEIMLNLPGTNSQIIRALTEGYTLTARATSQVEKIGQSGTLLITIQQLQKTAAGEIMGKLPLRISSVIAAMTVGEKNYIQDETLSVYRTAGLSHVLVVSGLHLAILCGWLLRFERRHPKHRRVFGIVGILFIVFFMLFTGLTPSVVRSGVVWLMVFIAWLFRRKADIYTSMGIAAILLILQNPYAAADIGLLLSFTAALGAVLGGTVENYLAQRLFMQERGFLLRMLFRLAGMAIVAICVNVATLPVLIWAGMGFSLFSLPANILVIPLLPVIILCGFVLIIPASVPVLGGLTLLASAIGGGLLVFVESVAAFIADLPNGWLPLGGVFVFAVVSLVYMLVFCAYKTKKYAVFAIITAITVIFALIMHSVFEKDTIRVAVAGRGQNASLVVIYDGSATVLYRSRQSLWYVQDILKRYSVENCELLVDMRMGTLSREYNIIEPETVITTQNQLMGNTLFDIAPEIELALVRQGDGTIACINIAGYKIGAYTGSVNLDDYSRLDTLLAGSGKVEGSYGVLITGSTAPTWADDEAELIINDEGTIIWVRPGKDVKISNT